MLTSFLCLQSLFMISKQDDTGELKKFLICTCNEISEICENSKSEDICEFESLDFKILESVFNDFYIKEVSYRIKENEEKNFEAKNLNGDNLFNIKISLFKNDSGGFEDKIGFFSSEIGKIPTMFKNGLKSDAYIVENDINLRKKLEILLEFIVIRCKITLNELRTKNFFKKIEEIFIIQVFFFRKCSQRDMFSVNLYNESNIKLRLLVFILLDHVILGLPVNDLHDPKLFLKKSKIFSNQKLKNIIYLDMAIIKEMGPLITEIENVFLKTDFIKEIQELLVDLKTIKDEFTSIHEDFEKLNEEIKDFKVDSYSEESFNAEKIIDSIDAYLCNRKKHNEKLRDNSSRNSIISMNYLKYNDVAQRYLKEYKLLLSDISFNEKLFIRNSSAPNFPSNSQSLELETIEEKKEIDEIEAAIDNSLLDIIKHVQTGRQWYVKEYEESA